MADVPVSAEPSRANGSGKRLAGLILAADCVRLDLGHVEDWSLRGDLIVRAKTTPAVSG